jgi:hypothetical protein
LIVYVAVENRPIFAGPVFVMDRVGGSTIVVALAWAVAPSAELTIAVSVQVPTWSPFRTRVTVAVAPDAIVPRFQVTVDPETVPAGVELT